jgi:hypothetical protein
MAQAFLNDTKLLSEALATRRMLDSILAIEAEHADALSSLPETLDAHFSSARRA